MRERILNGNGLSKEIRKKLEEFTDIEFDSFIRNGFIRMPDNDPLMIWFMKMFFADTIEMDDIESFRKDLLKTNLKEFVDSLSVGELRKMLITTNNLLIDHDKEYRLYVKTQLQQLFDNPLL